MQQLHRQLQYSPAEPWPLLQVPAAEPQAQTVLLQWALPQRSWHESLRGYRLLKALDLSFNPASRQKGIGGPQEMRPATY